MLIPTPMCGSSSVPLFLLATLLTLIEARPHPHPRPRPTFTLIRRQVPSTSTDTVGSSSESVQTDDDVASANVDGNGNMSGTGNPIVAIVIPIVVIAVLCIVLGIGLKYRHAIAKLFRLKSATTASNSSDTSSTTPLSRPTRRGRDSSRTLTAEQLATGTNLTSSSGDNTAGGTARTGTGTGARAGSARRSRRSVRGRNLRRTESGRSVRTLPVYSKEAGDEELVLVRKRSNSSFSDESFSEGDDANIEEALLQDTSADLRNNGETDITDNNNDSVDQGNDRPTSMRASPPTPGTPDVPTPQSAPPFTTSTPLPSEHIRSASITRRGWGEAPTYLEAMSSPSFDVEAGTATSVPPPSTFRTRTSSTFRDFLSRAGLAPSRSPTTSAGPMLMSERQASQTHLLHPSTSRLSSTASSFRRESISSLHPSLAGGAVGMATSPYGGSPWQSTHSLIISSPIPDTAVRASFESSNLPRAGLNVAQMQFLSSREAVNLAGVKLGEVPENKKRRRGSRGMQDLVGEPPSWEESEETRRRSVGEGEHEVNEGGLGDAEGSGGRDSSSEATQIQQVDDGESPTIVTAVDEGGSASTSSSTAGESEAARSPSQGQEVSAVATAIPITTPHFEIEPPTPVTSAPPSRAQSMLVPLAK
ncbi:hypothetical protein CI109_102962 [Kwoniella shandongensis]|uniref:Uncharacterized protein n=1 Tax=Kwoniella shandongensis TaxID=1734106 RepID=A0A5M6C9Q3_9TREE|nr:uncharacterized protein CI109_000150 [Kwoniella shandongensis]KAA5531310.1 hypothetical protein CI109_000150 [Kwoniella shandongensis]